jgi:hypothetical protein
MVPDCADYCAAGAAWGARHLLWFDRDIVYYLTVYDSAENSPYCSLVWRG